MRKRRRFCPPPAPFLYFVESNGRFPVRVLAGRLARVKYDVAS